MTERRLVLIISKPEDEHVDRLTGLLHQAGAETILLASNEMGEEVGVGIGVGGNTSSRRWLTVGRRSLDWATVGAVWYRRAGLPALREDHLSGGTFPEGEWGVLLDAVFALGGPTRWVSHPDLVRRSSHRPLQLARANVLGFRVPLTLVTSNPAEVRSFVERFDGPTVVKPIDADWVYSSAESSVIRALTSSLGGPDPGDEPGARPAPLMVQEEVESAYEVRVHVVGQRMLAVKIEGQARTGPVGTWGQHRPPRERCTPYNLPARVERRCAELARSFGLELAAIDLIRSRDGEYVFLEIDGSPDFLWLEDRSGVPVSAALADLLAGTVPSRRPADRSHRACRRASSR
jgi:hypothetical protein